MYKLLVYDGIQKRHVLIYTYDERIIFGKNRKNDGS